MPKPDPLPAKEVAWCSLRQWFKSLENKLVVLGSQLQHTLEHLAATEAAHYHAYAVQEYLNSLTHVKHSVDNALSKTRGCFFDEDSIQVSTGKFKTLKHPDDQVMQDTTSSK